MVILNNEFANVTYVKWQSNIYMWIWKKLSMETSNWTNTKAFEMWMWNICALYAYRFKLWNGVEVLRDILLPLLPLPKVMRIKWSKWITSLFYFISILFKWNIWTVTEGFYSLQINAYIEMPSNIIHCSLCTLSVHIWWKCALNTYLTGSWWNTFIPDNGISSYHIVVYRTPTNSIEINVRLSLAKTKEENKYTHKLCNDPLNLNFLYTINPHLFWSC